MGPALPRPARVREYKGHPDQAHLYHYTAQCHSDYEPGILTQTLCAIGR